MLLKDIKKGMKILLRDGRIAVRADSAHSLTPLIETDGYWGKEIGSIYCWEFEAVLTENGLVSVEFTERQKKWIAETQEYCRQHGML